MNLSMWHTRSDGQELASLMRGLPSTLAASARHRRFKVAVSLSMRRTPRQICLLGRDWHRASVTGSLRPMSADIFCVTPVKKRPLPLAKRARSQCPTRLYNMNSTIMGARLKTTPSISVSSCTENRLCWSFFAAPYFDIAVEPAIVKLPIPHIRPSRMRSENEQEY